MNYKDLLEHSYSVIREQDFGLVPRNRLGFLAEYVFDFTTYDWDISKELAQRALEVCERINTSKYPEPHEQLWHVVMCNMPFFSRRIEWGTSIRSAWWNEPMTDIGDSCGLYEVDKPITIYFKNGEWPQFIAAMLEFAGPERSDRRQ